MALEVHDRLSRISTCWTLVFQAQEGEPTRVSAAHQALMLRYRGAIYRYLLAALRDADAAEEVAQDFAYCLVRGDFKQAHPGKGRFRDFVKTVVFHLIVNYQRQRQKQARLEPLPADGPEAAGENPALADQEREFLDKWREELLDRTWAELAAVQRAGDPPFYEVLRLRSEQPIMKSAAIANQLGGRLGKPLTAAGVRQILHRAREKFADLLLEEVGRSLETTDADRLEQELIDLGLLRYCRSALERRAGDNKEG
jgi:RNA polymerase sigma-70 factor (ECF subfamily)